MAAITVVLVCSDFWFADVVQQATRLPDVILVAALSVSRKPGPDYSRMLWRHLAVSRAYEFGAYVGISDWAYPSELPAQFASGVGGFADPTTITAEGLFTPIGKRSNAVHVLDFQALDEFRTDRISRGFFLKNPREANPEDISGGVHAGSHAESSHTGRPPHEPSAAPRSVLRCPRP